MSWGTLEEVPEEVSPEVHRRNVTPHCNRFAGQKVLVTGAGRGLGSQIALAFAKEGADVAVHYHASAEGAEKVAAEIKGMGRDAFTVQADVTKWDDVRRMADEVWRRWGRLDILIHQVGEMVTNQMSWREMKTEADVRKAIDVDALGSLLVIHEVGRRMYDLQKYGTIVAMASNVLTTGSPRAPQYAAGKFGVVGVVKSYANAFAPWVRVNAVAPGYIETEATKARPDWPKRRKFVLQNTPLKRICQVEDVIPVIMFLASGDSGFITGHTIYVDGGFTMPH